MLSRWSSEKLGAIMLLADPSDPAAWEAHRIATPTPDLLRALRGRPEPICRARYVEALALSREPEGWREALGILDREAVPLATGLRVQLLSLLRLWDEAVTLALDYDLPDNAGPLDLEEASLVLMMGGMSARVMGRQELAARLQGGAIVLCRQLGMAHRGRMLRVEGVRVDNLQGTGEPERARALLEPGLPPTSHAHIVHVHAETLCARGVYGGARGALSGLEDARSVGMRAFCAAMLGLPVVDPGGNDDWLRLARCVRALQGGVWALDDLDMLHEPQATYARLLTACGEVMQGRSTGALRLLTDTAPGFADQRAAWAFLRVRAGMAAGLGVVCRDALGVWAGAVGGMYEAQGTLRLLASTAPEWFTLLSFLPDAAPGVVQVRSQLPLLVGADMRQGGEMVAGKGRAGVVLIGEAVGAEVKPLESSERKRWEDRLRVLRRTNILPRDPVNLGAVLDLGVELGALGVDVRHALREVAAMLSEDARDVVFPALEGVTDEETLAFIRGGAGTERRGIG